MVESSGYVYVEPTETEKSFLAWLDERRKTIVWKYGRWLRRESDGADHDEDYCEDCVIIQRYVERHKKTGFTSIDRWDDSPEVDSSPFCARCGCMLHHSLTRYGVEEEIANLADVSELSACDAAALHNLLDGIGDYRREEDWTSIEPHAIRLMGSSGEQKED